MKRLRKIGKGRYQEVFLYRGRVIKIARNIKYPEASLRKLIEYYLQIKSVQIPVPQYLGSSSVVIEEIITEWEYVGKPIEIVIRKGGKELVLSILGQILEQGNKAYKASIAFYPILEQFTMLNKTVYFVDFYPSRVREDFKSYTTQKSTALSLMFLGLTQKVLIPAKKVLELRPDLREDIIFITTSFLQNNNLSYLIDDFKKLLFYELPSKKLKGADYRRLEPKPVKIFRNPFEIDDSCEIVALLPGLNLWTRRLLKNDLAFVDRVSSNDFEYF